METAKEEHHPSKGTCRNGVSPGIYEFFYHAILLNERAENKFLSYRTDPTSISKRKRIGFIPVAHGAGV
jgi:hypothetical protein